MPNISSLLNEDPAQFDMPPASSIVQWCLLSEIILVVYPLFSCVFSHDLNAIVIGSIEHRSLPIAVNIV